MITKFNQYLLLEKTTFDKLNVSKEVYKKLFSELKQKNLELNGNFECELSNETYQDYFENLEQHPLLFIIGEKTIGFSSIYNRFNIYIDLNIDNSVQIISDFETFFEFIMNYNPKIYIINNKINRFLEFKNTVLNTITIKRKYINLLISVIDNIYLKLKDIQNNYHLEEFNADDIDYMEHLFLDLKKIKAYKVYKYKIDDFIEQKVYTYLKNNKINTFNSNIERNIIKWIYNELLNEFTLIKEWYSIKNLRNNPELYNKLSKDIINKKYLKEIEYLSNANKFDLI